MTKAIIINLEGVIIDSPYFKKNKERILAREAGLTFDDEMFLNMYGNQNLDTDNVEQFQNQGGETDLDQDTSVKYDYNPDYIDEIEAYDEALEFLENTAAKYRLALVSETRNSFVSAALEKYQLAEYFDIVVTSDDLTYAKPDPEIYEDAVVKLDLPKDEIIVIEYAPYGIDAAKDAGLKVVAVNNKYMEDELEGAYEVIDDLSEWEVA